MFGIEMKIVTYNVNGLKQRISQHGSLLNLLNSLDSDIICFQETKISREDLTADLIMAEGYESFFSCTRTSARGRIGYSAEEGFTGLLEHTRGEDAMRKDFLLEVRSKVEDINGITNTDLFEVDREGRCIITDHRHFVVFNIYGPRADCDDTERINFKHKFFKILQKRWEALLRQGKRIFVVGDLNIAPAAIDHCDAGPDFDNNQFRKWLRSILKEKGGPFVDVFRAKHPDRKEAYTCWSVQNGAEEFNFGSRIDHILVAGSCLHQNHDRQGHNFANCHVDECDILTKFKRWKPESIPRWKGGKNKLEGSDHVPVFVSLREIPELPDHNTPSLSARYVPKILGVQQTIVSLLSRTQVAGRVKGHEVSQQQLSDVTITMESCNSSLKRSSLSTPARFSKSSKKGKNINSNQRTLGSYFQKNINLKQEEAVNGEAKYFNLPKEVPVGSDESKSFQNIDINTSPSTPDSVGVISHYSSENEKQNVALLEWQRIQQLMRDSIPLCKGHREPCVARVVKKGDSSNLGRRFFTCRRAKIDHIPTRYQHASSRSEESRSFRLIRDFTETKRSGEEGRLPGIQEGWEPKTLWPQERSRKSWTLGNAYKEKKTDQGSTCFNCGNIEHWARECHALRVATDDRVQTYQAVVDNNSAPLEFAASDFFNDTDVVMDRHTE
ncbi:hypothetical protein GIB67_010685 [Kingdonia uniflora]|uniref:DNA-(apurinic or apyrimidinic site) endonuclease n=1 Tax=Kingdonia uniflora TaxID=39325 RepID=A0A7J7MPB5_9MAGN|nr:hypothetical protein GIB67_010685 [Kingdonia uniflora]